MMQGQGFTAGSDRSFPLADRDYPFRSEPPSPALSDLDDGAVTPSGPSCSFIPLLSASRTDDVDGRDLVGASVSCEPGTGNRGKLQLSRCSSESFLLQETSPFTTLALPDASDGSWLDLRHNHSYGSCRDGDVGFGLFGAQLQAPGVLELLATEASSSSAPLSPWDWSAGSGEVGATIEGQHAQGCSWRKLSEDVPGGKDATALTEQEIQAKEGEISPIVAHAGRQGAADVTKGPRLEGDGECIAPSSLIRHMGAHVSDSELQPCRELLGTAPGEPSKSGACTSVVAERMGSSTTASTQSSSLRSSPHDWSPMTQVQCPTFTQAGAAYTQLTTPWAFGQVRKAAQENMRENSLHHREQGVRHRAECCRDYAWQTNDSGGATPVVSLQRPGAGFHQGSRHEIGGLAAEHVNRAGGMGHTPSPRNLQVTRCVIGYEHGNTSTDCGRDRTPRGASHDKESYEASLGFGTMKSAMAEMCISPSSLTRSTTASSMTALPPDKADPSWVVSSPSWSETDSDYVRGSTGASCEAPSDGTFRGSYVVRVNERVNQSLPGTVSVCIGRPAANTVCPVGVCGAAHTRQVVREGVGIWSRNQGVLGKADGRWDRIAHFGAPRQLSVERGVTGVEHQREVVGCRQYPERTMSLPSAFQCPSFVGSRPMGAMSEVVDPFAGVQVRGQPGPRPMDMGRLSRKVHCTVPPSRCLGTGAFASHPVYTGYAGDTNAHILVPDTVPDHARHITYSGKGACAGHRQYEGVAEERRITDQASGDPAWLSCSSELPAGHNSGSEYQHLPGASPSAGCLVGDLTFAVKSSHHYGAPTDDSSDPDLRRLYESQDPGGSCSGCNVDMPAGTKRSRYDSEGILFSEAVIKKVRSSGDNENEGKRPPIFDTESACPEVETGAWQTLAPKLSSCSREELERCQEDGGTQCDEDSSLQWHEGFTLPLGKDGRGELIKRMRSVHKADREFCRFSLEGMGIDFKRLAHATVEELWKIAYRWGLFGYAVKLSKKYGKTATGPSRKKAVQALSAVPSLQPASSECKPSR
ncbi:hypothetical protein BESB_008350 [Besnoitia besnoiti]|uniref:Uncharacterized protein n=1 Tax=Besnoitia besnoiti TaxID=94643 RepID=A0A2A9MQG5_BESBE|nr:hypothetical protein BESB_008350 [Besnoitia besnoiti]PFH38493.1 hypothetical protein BESB_008350 [Besnoitia besnoiti]